MTDGKVESVFNSQQENTQVNGFNCVVDHLYSYLRDSHVTI